LKGPVVVTPGTDMYPSSGAAKTNGEVKAIVGIDNVARCGSDATERQLRAFPVFGAN
jgi:hypothetical protein